MGGGKGEGEEEWRWEEGRTGEMRGGDEGRRGEEYWRDEYDTQAEDE